MGASTPRTDWIWKDGEMIPWDDARLHVMSHVVHYGSSVFEGIRFYETTEGPAIFRLTDHVRRFYESCRVYRMKPWVVAAELRLACAELVERNELESGYIRPISIRGVGALGVDPADSPVETYIVCWPWGEYLGAEALGSGVDACVSTWLRPAPNTHPALAKAGGNYLNGQLMKMEARLNGYAEAIALGDRGLVSEGSGQNIFLVRDGTVLTPRLDGTMLQGITRDCVIRLAQVLGIPVREQDVPRELLYQADEVFFTGTASEITPVRSIDRIPVGDGEVGPVTRTLQEEYLGVAGGTRPDRFGWLEHVRVARTVAV